MVVRKVNGKLPDANSNVNVGTVTSINDITPNSYGELILPINIPNGKFITVEELMLPTMLDSGNYMVVVSDGTILPYENQCMVNVAIFDTSVSKYKGKVLTVTNLGDDGTGNGGKLEASVKLQLIDTEEDSIVDGGEWTPYTSDVLDVLDSTDTNKALSANMGKVLYDMNNFIVDELDDHVQEYASAGALGHVRIDSDTIKMDADTKRIYVSTASETQKGAVKVDGETIIIDENGVIKAVGGGSGESVPDASLTVKGKVQLTNEVTPGASESLALTQKGANNLYLQNNLLAIAFDDHMLHVASDGNLGTLGHVKPDGVTITADEEGVISVIGGGSTTLSDNYMLNDSNVASSTKATTNLANDFVDNINDLNAEDDRLRSAINLVSGQLNVHRTVIASETLLGHVMVDGITILADETGKLTSVAERGEQGEDGKDGSKWYIGAGDPTGVAVGVEGDFYLDRNDGQVYGHNGTSWVEAPANLKGSKWSVGQTVPVVGYPATENDYFLHMPSCDVYVYTNNAWVKTEYNIKGTDGADGNKGDKGDQGDPLQIVDNLTSTDTDKALSANQGKVLGELYDDLDVRVIDAEGEIARHQEVLETLELDLDTHSKLNASTTELGHVMVDGNTIQIDADGIISAVSDYDITNDDILPTTPASEFSNGLTISAPRAGASNVVYEAWKDWVISTSGANLDYAVPFYVYIETTRSDTFYTMQTIRVIAPSFGVNGYNEVMHITRCALTETGDFNAPGVQMTTIRGSGNPEGEVHALIGNSYYDYTNKVMYVKTEEGPVDPKANGWTLASNDTIVENILTSTSEVNALSANQGKVLKDSLDAHLSKKASTTEFGHVKIDGQSVKMNENDQLFVDVGELPIPVQVVNEFIPSNSPSTYPPGHTITLLNSDAPGFSNLISLFNIDFNVELSSLNVRFIVETIKSSNNITHQTAKAVTASRGTVLATAYRFSQSSFYGFSSWYTHTQTLVGRGVPGDGGRGEGINGNMYVDVLTGKVYAKSGSDKTVGYSNWKNVSLNVVNNTFSPVIDDVENVYSAYTTNEMILSHASTKATESTLGHVKVDGSTIQINNDGVISTVPIRINNQYVKGTLVALATEATFDVSAINVEDATFEVYDSGLLLMNDEYTLDYVEEDDELVFEWVGKPYPTTIMVKISKIAIAYN